MKLKLLEKSLELFVTCLLGNTNIDRDVVEYHARSNEILV